MAVPKPAAKPTPTPRSAATQSPPFPGYLSPAQQTKAVTGQVQAAQLPQQTLINQQAARSAAQAQAQQSSTQQGYDALAQILKSIGPATQAGYQSAAGDTAAYARGMSDGFAHLQSQTQGEAGQVLGLSGGSAAQVPMANLGGTGVTNAMYDLNGYIPAAGLEREGAAFGAAADRLPATAAGQGWQERLKIAAQQAQDAQGFRDQQSTLAAQIPGLRQQGLSNIQTQQGQLASNYQTQLQNAATNRAEQQRIEIARITATETNPDGSLTPQGKKDVAAIAAQNRQLDIQQQNANTAQTRADTATTPKYSASVSRSLGYRADQFGNPQGGKVRLLPGFGYDAKGNIVKTSSATATTKVHGFTASQVAKFKGEALAGANAAVNGVPATAKAAALPPISYEEYILRGREHGIPDWILIPTYNSYKYETGPKRKNG